MRKWTATWTSLPPEYKKRWYLGICAYIAIIALTSLALWMNAGHALDDWRARFPHAETPIAKVYLTPQLTEVSDETFDTIPGFDKPSFSSLGIPSIALIVTDMGLSSAATERAIDDLPKEVALAFSPYAHALQESLSRAQASGKDTLILLPMEPDTYPQDDPGPGALLVRLGEQENEERLRRILNKAHGVAGAMNFMGSLFLADTGNLETVFKELKKSDIFFIESPVGGASAVITSAEETALPAVVADIVLDNNPDEPKIREKLIDLEKIAREKGFAVAVAHPFPVTLNMIKSWSSTLEKRGLALKPVSALAAQKPRLAPENVPDNKAENESGHEH